VLTQLRIGHDNKGLGPGELFCMLGLKS
jgi:hypothetical protein